MAANALKTKINGIFTGPPSLQTEAAAVVGKLGITEVGPILFGLVGDASASPATHVVALNALEVLKDAKLANAVRDAIASADPKLRNAGRAILIKTKPDDVIKQLKLVLAKDDIIENQGALALLATVKSPEVDEVIESWLERLINGKAPAELQLDILEAAAKRPSTRLQILLKSYEYPNGRNPAGRLEGNAQWRRCRERPRYLPEQGGRSVPALSQARRRRRRSRPATAQRPGPKQKREYLLESLVFPNKQIAKGYESILIEKTDGKTVSGVLKSEDAKEVKLMTAEGQLLTIPKSEIEDRRATKTAMPEDVVQKLTKREIRDLVEFLAGLKEEWKK